VIKVVYIISDINKALPFEWIADYINKENFELSFILLNPGPSFLEEYLFQKGFKVVTVKCKGKQDWPLAFIRTYKLLRNIKPNVVHCHLLQANIIGLTAAKLAGIKSRIYTRHHSSLHHIYFKKGIFWDKLANKMATTIIAISGIVKKILTEWEKVPEKKVRLIPHGFLLQEFCDVGGGRVERFKARSLIGDAYPVIGVISRFTEWKGVQHTVQAFTELVKQYPRALLLLLNAHGDYRESILEHLKSLPENSYRLVPFEKDVAAAYKAMDIFIHVPIDEHSEAFGQIYVEALAAGVPSIFTRSGIANAVEFNEANAIFVDYKNPDQIIAGVNYILNEEEETIRRVKAGKELSGSFSLQIYIQRLENLYLESV
jgi:glycosyltransferase involved in cell wall biosynthesis